MPITSSKFRLENLVDSSLYNNESDGKFLFTHLKYYNGTVDLISSFPKEMQESFIRELNGMIEKNKGKSHDIIDGLIEQKYFSANSGQSIKQYVKDLQIYLNSIPEKDNVMKWCVDKEDAIRGDKVLSYKEKIQILSHQALVRYALKWKMELMVGGVKNGRVQHTNDFWSDLACWVGSISGFAGSGVVLLLLFHI